MTDFEKKVITGGVATVVLENEHATKYYPFNQLYWASELAFQIYLLPFKTDNIVKMLGVKFTDNIPDETNLNCKKCVIFKYPRYRSVLYDVAMTKDKHIVQMLLDMLSALTFLHKKNIMHRDIKPTNIVVGNNNRYALIDFSHVYKEYRQTSDLTDVMVTSYYRAPEVFQYTYDLEESKNATPYTKAIDIWALGMTLFETICNSNMCLLKFGDIAHDKPFTTENRFGKYLTESTDFENDVKSYYSTCARYSLEHRDEYFKWIQLMLNRNPLTRITAKEMYDQILQFAEEKKIPIVIPENGTTTKSIETKMVTTYDLILSDEQEKLYDDCVECLSFVNNSDMLVAEQETHTILKYYVHAGRITKDNYINYTKALRIILMRIVYDYNNVLDDELEYLSSIITEIFQKDSEILFGINRKFVL